VCLAVESRQRVAFVITLLMSTSSLTVPRPTTDLLRRRETYKGSTSHLGSQPSMRPTPRSVPGWRFVLTRTWFQTNTAANVLQTCSDTWCGTLRWRNWHWHLSLLLQHHECVIFSTFVLLILSSPWNSVLRNCVIAKLTVACSSHYGGPDESGPRSTFAAMLFRTWAQGSGI